MSKLFEIISGTLWLFKAAFEQSDINFNYYSKENSIGNKKIEFMNHPKDARVLLVAYESIGELHKKKIQDRYGNPYDTVARMPIKNLINENKEAYNFYLTYTYGEDGKKLPIKRVREYSRAVDYIECLRDCLADKKIIKNLKLSVPQFIDHYTKLASKEIENAQNEAYTGSEVFNALVGILPTTMPPTGVSVKIGSLVTNIIASTALQYLHFLTWYQQIYFRV